MAKITRELKKEVISNLKAKSLSDNLFNEIALSEEKFDDEKILHIYNDLFYIIPKRGNSSHESIVILSSDYLHPEVNKNLETNIAIAEEEISVLNEKYTELSQPTITAEHPLFQNGSFIQEGDPSTNTIINPGSDIWYMQQGMKRKMGTTDRGYWVRVLRQAQGENVYNDGNYISLKDSPNYVLATAPDISSIPSGEPINNAEDLNIHPLLGIEQENIYASVEVDLHCIGEEKFYKYRYGYPGYDYDLSGYPETGGYWYMDTSAGCKVFLAKPDGGFQRTTFKGKKTYTLSRDPKYYNHSTGVTDDPLLPEFWTQPYNFSNQKRNYHPDMEVYKQWGEGTIFPSILEVQKGHEIHYRLNKPTHWDLDGNVTSLDPSSHHLSGIKDKTVFTSTYNELATRGMRMIYKDCYGPSSQGGCYGKLGQESTLQNTIFDDVNNNYYQYNEMANLIISGNVYGQPILKVNGKYMVFLGTYREYLTDWNAFYDLQKSGDNIHWVKNKNLDDEVVGYTRDSKRYFDWIIDGSPNPKIYYLGLQGYKINQEGADYSKNDNPFNPTNGGSNYDLSEITPNYNW